MLNKLMTYLNTILTNRPIFQGETDLFYEWEAFEKGSSYLTEKQLDTWTITLINDMMEYHLDGNLGT